MSLSKESFEAIIEREGRTIQFDRQGSSVSVKAKVKRSRNDPASSNLTAGMIEEGFIVTCSNKEMAGGGWPYPPRTGDRVIFDGEYHMVRTVYILYLAETLVGYRVQVSG